MLSSENENGQVTTYEYETDTLRPKKTVLPNGGYSETEYSDKLISNPNDLLPGFVRQTTTLETNKFAQSYSYFDGRGLGIRSATQTPDGWSIAAAGYDRYDGIQQCQHEARELSKYVCNSDRSGRKKAQTSDRLAW
jgi:hypothetical protein